MPSIRSRVSPPPKTRVPSGGGYPTDLGGSEENGGGGASAKGGDVSAAVGVRLPTRRSQSGAVVRIYLLCAQKRYELQYSVMYLFIGEFLI